MNEDIKLTRTDIKFLVLSISNHLKFLCEKKIITMCEYVFDFMDIDIFDNPNDDDEKRIFTVTNKIFIEPIRNKLKTATTIKEHRKILDEMKFIVEEIYIIVDEFLKTKKRQKEEYDNEYRFGVERLFNREKGGLK